MVYYISNESNRVQFFNPRWDELNNVSQSDIEEILTYIDCDVEDLTFHGRGLRLKVKEINNNKIVYNYDGKHFYTSIDSNHVTVLLRDQKPVVFIESEQQLNKLLKTEVNRNN